MAWDFNTGGAGGAGGAGNTGGTNWWDLWGNRSGGTTPRGGSDPFNWFGGGGGGTRPGGGWFGGGGGTRPSGDTTSAAAPGTDWQSLIAGIMSPGMRDMPFQRIMANLAQHILPTILGGQMQSISDVNDPYQWRARFGKGQESIENQLGGTYAQGLANISKRGEGTTNLSSQLIGGLANARQSQLGGLQRDIDIQRYQAQQQALQNLLQTFTGVAGLPQRGQQGQQGSGAGGDILSQILGSVLGQVNWF